MKTLALIVGPLAAAAAGLTARWFGLPDPACWTVVVTVWCSLWWVLEPVPIPATSLIPFAVFPLAGVLDHRQVAGAYGDTIILLFLGGFLLSAAMERSGTHHRLAIGMLRLLSKTGDGLGGRRLVLGFMIVSAALSMWISNTATALMLLPIAVAVLQKIDNPRLATALMLGIAYGCNIGGVGTPIGTPPNLIFIAVYEKATGNAVSFLDWMKIGVPVVLVMVPIAWRVLVRGIAGTQPIELLPLGPWRHAEVRTLIVFAVTALAWVTRTDPLGGWSSLLGITSAGDSTVALAAALALFIIPNGTGQRLMDWDTAQRIPWGLLLLFGGGLAIAEAFTTSGLTQSLAHVFSGLTHWPVVAMVFTVCLTMIFFSEIASNTAAATMLMPVLATAAKAAGIDPATLMVPAVISTSCAFMLPVGTPPNAIAIGSGRVTVNQMARAGLWINLIGAVAITVLCVLLVGK